MACSNAYNNASTNETNFTGENGFSKDIYVGNTLFNCRLVEVSDCAYDLICTPCNIPTSVYCVARITRRENCCNNMQYFQSFINTDPVEIIQDCNLCDIIERSIAIYFDNIPAVDTASNNNNNCGRGIFGLF